jgi:hypothetical protein
MGSLFSTPSAPPPPPPPAAPPIFANPITAQAGTAASSQARAAAGQGFDNTVATGPQGAPAGNTGKQALGS